MEQRPVESNGRHQEKSRADGGAQHYAVHESTFAGYVLEPRREGKCEQEAGEDLYAGLGYPEFLEEFLPVAVQVLVDRTHDSPPIATARYFILSLLGV